MNFNHNNSPYGIFTDRVGVLTSMDFEWKQDGGTK